MTVARWSRISEAMYCMRGCISHQAGAAGPPAHRGGHRADGAHGGAAGAVGQRGDAHGHALALLGLGRAGGGEADADHLVDRSEQAELGGALEVPRGREGRGVRGQGLGVSKHHSGSSCPRYSHRSHALSTHIPTVRYEIDQLIRA